MEYSPKHLIMVTGDANHNKYYNMIPHGDSWTAEYGRVGASCQKRTYSIREWDKKYREKIAKGYNDVTDISQDLIEEDTSGESCYKPISNESVRNIIDKLQKIAKKTISANYTISSNKVTQAMVDTAQDLLNNLVGFSGTVDDFNKKLIEIFNTIPRKMKNVSDYLVKTSSEFDKIIQREADLLDVMRGQVVVRNTSVVKNTEDSKEITILEELGLEMDDITSDEEIMIKKLMGSNSDKFIRAFKVKHIESNDKFNKYLNERKIQNTDLLWHGSRSCNWFSILSQSLKIRPTGVATNGALFGADGIYFANNVMKSRNYCGMRGSYWVSGDSNTGFVALFETAYGDKPYDVYSFSSEYYNMNEERLNQKLKGATCLHAHAGTKLNGSWSKLVNDEIIFYNENAVTIRYLVEIK